MLVIDRIQEVILIIYKELSKIDIVQAKHTISVTNITLPIL